MEVGSNCWVGTSDAVGAAGWSDASVAGGLGEAEIGNGVACVGVESICSAPWPERECVRWKGLGVGGANHRLAQIVSERTTAARIGGAHEVPLEGVGRGTDDGAGQTGAGVKVTDEDAIEHGVGVSVAGE